MIANALEGQILDGRYRILTCVGKGAMGSVYRGEHLKLGRAVAIKMINDHVPGAMASRERFEREALAMAKLEHPNCAAVLDVGVHDEMPYVVMDFVTGKNLKEVLASGPLPIGRAIDICRQVLAGLSCAHEQGIIHRDIKPANIVLSQKPGLGDHVTILDFGLAKFSQQNSSLTSGFAVGTPSYMAPEQILGRPVDQRTDLYASGVLLFELLTGQVPFQSADGEATSICMMHVSVDAPSLRTQRPGTDFGPLEGIVARALAKRPEDRFATATAFSDALADVRGVARAASSPGIEAAPPQALSTVPISAGAVAEPKVARSRPWIALGGTAVLIAAAVITWLTVRGGSSTAEAPATEPVSKPVSVDAAAAPPVAPDDAVAELVKHANDIAAAGNRGRAIDLLVKARKDHPTDARLPYQAGLLYLQEMWWPDGLKQLRAAISIDPALKSDDELIKAVLRGFNTTAQYDWTLASFLHDEIGQPARPYLEEVAQQHPNPLVRKRAAAELRRY